MRNIHQRSLAGIPQESGSVRGDCVEGEFDQILALGEAEVADKRFGFHGKIVQNEGPDPQLTSEAGKHTSERERIAMEAEREMVDLKKAHFMMDKVGGEFSGFVTSLTGFGFFVELESYFVEGLVRLSSLTDDSYHYYEKENLIKGRRTGRTFRLGDSARVKVTRINAFRSEIDFELV